MNLKKIKIIAIIAIFIISFGSHFIYDVFPNTITSIFFPVNESIWEHMKILTTSILIYSPIDYILLKNNNIKFNNFILQLVLTSIISIPIYLIIYLPLYNIIGENLFISIFLLLITYIIIEYISYQILQKEKYHIPNMISILLIITIYIIYTIFTYNPPKYYIFYDTLTQHYGIPLNKN